MTAAAGRAPHTLSLGQRRRVAIATVLAMEPALLVLDEPSANLDPRARRDLVGVLEEVAGTMLLVTHDLPLAAQLCDRAVVLDVGRIVADGPCGAVLADTGLLAAHGLELPVGFDLVARPPRFFFPDGGGRRMTLAPETPSSGAADLPSAIAALRARGMRVSAARRLLLAALVAAAARCPPTSWPAA